VTPAENTCSGLHKHLIAPGGVQTITTQLELPAITEAVLIDGTTHPAGLRRHTAQRARRQRGERTQ
jgi:hypothetical protein